MIDMSKQDKTLEEVSRDRTVLIDYLEESEKDKAKLISKYEGIISNLEVQIEELNSPRFTKMDAALAEDLMMKNTNQTVGEGYHKNPFWDRVEEQAVELDFEAELVRAMNDINAGDPEMAHGDADDILVTALNHCGYERLTTAYDELIARCAWWACA
jgi:hypothetical protein